MSAARPVLTRDDLDGLAHSAVLDGAVADLAEAARRDARLSGPGSSPCWPNWRPRCASVGPMINIVEHSIRQSLTFLSA